MAGNKEYSLAALAQLLDLECKGEPEKPVTGLGTLANAGATQLSFYNNPRYHRDLLSTRAAAVIIGPEHAALCPVNVLVSEQPYIAFARATQLFSDRRLEGSGISPSASVHPDSVVHPSAWVAHGAVIDAGAQIGPRVHVGANCHVGANTCIGADSWLYPNVVIYAACRIGQRALIHAGVVIGSDGFGFAFDGKQHVKIEQLGAVEIGDDVELGAGSTVDRGALDDTVIGNGVKIDNQVQIAHNVKIGTNTVICGCSAIAGSATIGANCIIAGAVGIINHVTVADGVTVTAMSLVNRDIRKKGVYSSGTGLTETSLWKRNMLRFGELDSMAKQLKRISKESE